MQHAARFLTLGVAAYSAWLLLADALAPPFTALLPYEQLPRTVVLMHHKRLPELEATLRRLAMVARASELTVHVAQTVRADEARATNATGALLARLGRELPLRALRHAPAVLHEAAPDASFSVDAARYGTKKNSFRNMVHAMHAGFQGAPETSFAIVMEDDVEVSTDLLGFFDFGASIMDATRSLEAERRVALATSFCILRRGHPDYGFKGWLPGDYLPLRADRHRRTPLRGSLVTFKTFAWLASREVYEEMVRDAGALLARPSADTALHGALAGCPYCCAFCYDHYLEWRWRNASVVCPEVPRSRQFVLGGGGGMTEAPGSVETSRHALERSGTQLSEEIVHRWQHVDGAARQQARRWLNALAGVGAAWGVVLVAPWAAARLGVQPGTWLGGTKVGPVGDVRTKVR